MATLRYIGFSWQDVGARSWMLEDAQLLARGGVCSEDTRSNGTPMEQSSPFDPRVCGVYALRSTDLKLCAC